MAETDDTPPPVRRRHVLYLSGFDPQGPRQYHALFAAQAALQATVSGHTMEVGPRQRGGAHASVWDVMFRAEQDGTEVLTRYEMMRWDDIVREHWPTGPYAAMGLTLSNTWRMLTNGSLWKVMHISWPAAVALGGPGLLMLAIMLLVAFLLGLSAALVSEGSLLAALAATALGSWGLARLAYRLQSKLYMGWLMRSLAVVLRQSQGRLPALEQRMDHFAARLAELGADPELDELLVVGHSSGAMLAASVLARALAREPALRQGLGPTISLLTLGQCIPLLTTQPHARQFRSEVGSLRQRGEVAWLDFTAPADGCCAALTDPTAPALLAERGEPLPPSSGSGPKLLSPRFNKLFSPATYAQVRADKYRCHFQYLMATELPGDYDYFAITAGPMTLAQRFAHLPSNNQFRDFQLFGGPGA